MWIFLQTETRILRLIIGDIELTVFQNLAKIGLITIYYPVFYSFIIAVQTNILGWQHHNPAAELRGDRRVQDIYCSSLCLTENRAMQACDAVEVYFHASLTSAPVGKSG
jgi:hypothetical protein